MKSKHVLILGCGRSGTSIFGELFEHLPNYTYYSEPSFADLLTYDFTIPTAIKVPKVSPNFQPTIGLSFPIDVLQQLIPNLVVFWQVRHPLDTICSLKVGIAKNWGHHPQPPDWQDWLEEPLVKQCAYHWNYINTIGYDQVKDIATITKFETMIQDAEAFALKISHQIGLDTKPCQKEISDWAKRIQDKNNKDFIEAKTSKPYSTNDHKVKVGRWRENMSLDEKKLVSSMINLTAKRFGYEL